MLSGDLPGQLILSVSLQGMDESRPACFPAVDPGIHHVNQTLLLCLVGLLDALQLHHGNVEEEAEGEPLGQLLLQLLYHRYSVYCCWMEEGEGEPARGSKVGAGQGREGWERE